MVSARPVAAGVNPVLHPYIRAGWECGQVFYGLGAAGHTAAADTLASFERSCNAEALSHKAFLERVEALDKIRDRICLSGACVRDFLLAPGPGTAGVEASHPTTLKDGTHDAWCVRAGHF